MNTQGHTAAEHLGFAALAVFWLCLLAVIDVTSWHDTTRFIFAYLTGHGLGYAGGRRE